MSSYEACVPLPTTVCGDSEWHMHPMRLWECTCWRFANFMRGAENSSIIVLNLKHYVLQVIVVLKKIFPMSNFRISVCSLSNLRFII